MKPVVEALRGSWPERRVCLADAFDVAHTVSRDAEIIRPTGTGFTKASFKLGFVQAIRRQCISAHVLFDGASSVD